MSIRIIILGDIVGTPGRLAVAQCLPALREQYEADLVVVNGENVANGSGITPDLYKKLIGSGVDGITLGDHVYKKRQIVPVLERESNIIRPANLPRGAAGRTWMRLDPGGNRPAVYFFTVLGRVFMNMPISEPFAAIDQVMSQLPESEPIVIAEIHAEATSERQAVGWYLNGRAAAVFGTHTHVPTADARLLPTDVVGGGGRIGPGGTAYVSDLGMCGPMDSVLGRRVDRVLSHMTTSMPTPYDVADGRPMVQGIFLEIDERARQAVRIERIEMEADPSRPPFASA
ncbi:MAG: YmdB family metallophosphoesterase [Phycisphaeraceae bacterium]